MPSSDIVRQLGLKLIALSVAVLLVPSALGQTPRNQFSFPDYLLAPVRVHLLSAQDSPAIQTTLLATDITRILGKLNGVWAQAGLHFYLESLVSEEANHLETHVHQAREGDRIGLLGLRPQESLSVSMFHIYYLKEMPMNGIYFPEGIFVKDSASLRKVTGGLDEPLPRVTSHELGHAFGLLHRQDVTNLMASGTTGTWLNEAEIKQSREAAQKIGWIGTASDVLKEANTLYYANRIKEAVTLYSRLATIPSNDPQLELAKRRLTEARTTASGKGP